jgi:hypothetical protein
MTRIANWTLGVLAVAAAGGEARAEDVPEALRGLAPSTVVSERIVGGVPTTQSEWPWQTALYFHGGDGHDYFDCGGSLIAPAWILTAAHCFGGSRDAKDWTAVTGIGKMSYDGFPEGSTQRKVKRVVAHERYNKESHENDVALVELEEPLPAQKIEIQLDADRAMESDRTVTVTGWGRTRFLEPVKDGQGHVNWLDGVTRQPVNIADYEPSELRKATIPLVDVARCAKMEEGIKGAVIDARVLCAGLPEGGRDACQGDSGGPLMTEVQTGKWRQLGIVSVGVACGERKVPGIYTRVSAFGGWIRGVAGADLEGAAPPPSPEPLPAPAPVHDAAPSPAPEPVAPPAPAETTFDNSAGLTIAFDQGDDVAVGQLVAYRATTQKPGYLAIFDATPDGKLTQIYPNALSLRSPTSPTLESTRLDPGQPLLVPNAKNPYRAFKVRVTEPKGEGTIIGILADAPFKAIDTPDKPKTFGTSQDALREIKRIHDEMKRDLEVKAPVPGHPDWSVAIHKYTVH